ncbi:MAG: DNA mismatch repair endonuclease MutL [Bdellovibrionales bacterium]|nr:DNA mismatch repair endonuclease MutL [Bdellovibrionales bacterium]
MEKIQELKPEVIDQIAAGEVVERPAHLVKELIENSLDAGAKSILVEFSMGGQKVRVTDDGCGIPAQELPLAFARHATSKIRVGDDLWALSSFGFRGEALASLSAVSKVKMVSRTPKDQQASALEGTFGKFGSVEKTGGNLGTSIWIEDLFGNVPARKKFLKSEAAEATQIKNVIKAIALYHFQVEFRVLYKGELLYFWPTTKNPSERVKQILELEDVYFGEGQCENIKASVYISAPHQTLKNRKQMWFFAQGRWIQDRSLQAAVLDAYRGLLMHGEYPYAVVFVQSPPDEIDVNVHPTKSQVKFSEASHAFRAVHRAVRGVLEEAPWLEKVLAVHNRVNSTNKPIKINKIRTQDLITNMSFEANELQHTQWQQKEFVANDEFQSLICEKPTEKHEINVTLPKMTKGHYWQSLQVLSQAALTYIICQSQKSLVIVDQHAAHERVVYESLMEAWLNGKIEIQNLLIPLTIHLDPEKVEAIVSWQKDLHKMGFEVEAISPENLAISAIPTILKEKAIEKAFHFLGQELVEKGGSFALEKAMGDLAATMACHSVIRAGQAISHEEMKALLKSMDEYPLSSFCPHGRPVFVEIPFTKLEKDFGRIV